MKAEQQSTKLNRFTTLPALLDLLRRRKIVLRDPSTWEDKNDVKIILEYKRQKKIPNLFAVCFCVGGETVHHWKTYADGISGCCIEFDKKRLLKCFRGVPGVRCRYVVYKRIEEVIEEIKNDTIKPTITLSLNVILINLKRSLGFCGKAKREEKQLIWILT